MNTTTGGQAVTVTTEDRFFRALVEIRHVLGPDSFGCSEPICEGCQAEGAEALRIANEALGFASEGEGPPPVDRGRGSEDARGGR